MKTIKFRAWDNADVNSYSSKTDKRRMSFYGPSFSMNDDENSLIFYTTPKEQGPFGDHNSMERYTLMQFTNLVDKDGKGIYEGDIIERKCSDPHCKGRHIGEVVFEEHEGMIGYFLRSYEDKCDYPILLEDEHGFSCPISILGNSYENPELVK